MDFKKLWDEHRLEDKIREILKAETYPVNKSPDDKEHHLRPFLSSYQIAIKLYEEDDELEDKLGLKVGGKGIAKQFSLAQQVGMMLSKLIDEKRKFDIEGGFFSDRNLHKMVFKNTKGKEPKEIVSSNVGTGKGVSIYRMKDLRAG